MGWGRRQVGFGVGRRQIGLGVGRRKVGTGDTSKESKTKTIAPVGPGKTSHRRKGVGEGETEGVVGRETVTLRSVADKDWRKVPVSSGPHTDRPEVRTRRAQDPPETLHQDGRRRLSPAPRGTRWGEEGPRRKDRVSDPL